MAQKLPRPTDVELQILDVFWKRGPSTVREAHNTIIASADRKGTSYSTTLKMIQVLHEKGFLTRDASVRPQVYHPAAWWLSRHIRAERANCCDDIAAEVCGSPLALAEGLAAIETARRKNVAIGPALAALGPGGQGSTLRRVCRILGCSDANPKRDRTWLAGLLVLTLLLIAGVANFPWIAFHKTEGILHAELLTRLISFPKGKWLVTLALAKEGGFGPVAQMVDAREGMEPLTLRLKAKRELRVHAADQFNKPVAPGGLRIGFPIIDVTGQEQRYFWIASPHDAKLQTPRPDTRLIVCCLGLTTSPARTRRIQSK